MAQLHGELLQSQTLFRESQSNQENEKISLTKQIRELSQQKDQLHHEVRNTV